MQFHEVVETKEVIDFLLSRNLLLQYKKAKSYLQLGLFNKIRLKLREPKKDKIYYFRINKKYRAWAVIESNELRIFKIDDHQ